MLRKGQLSIPVAWWGREEGDRGQRDRAITRKADGIMLGRAEFVWRLEEVGESILTVNRMKTTAGDAINGSIWPGKPRAAKLERGNLTVPPGQPRYCHVLMWLILVMTIADSAECFLRARLPELFNFSQSLLQSTAWGKNLFLYLKSGNPGCLGWIIQGQWSKKRH